MKLRNVPFSPPDMTEAEAAEVRDANFSSKQKRIPVYAKIWTYAHLRLTQAQYGCQVPKGAWHTVEVIESSVIFESKDGKYMG